jgi:hypothetical protein
MVAMPYILVNMVSDVLSLILFCATSAALLSKYPWTNRYLPAQLRNHRILAFAAQGLVLSVLSIGVVFAMGSGRTTFLFARFIFGLFFYVGFANSVVLTYQFLDGRYFLKTPKIQRRLLIATCAVVMTSAAAIAVAIALVGLLTIR